MAAAKEAMPYKDDVQAEVRPGTEHVEAAPELKRDLEVVLKSSLDDLSLWATVWRFPKVIPCGALTHLTRCWLNFSRL
jgi:hypothetical protein